MVISYVKQFGRQLWFKGFWCLDQKEALAEAVEQSFIIIIIMGNEGSNTRERNGNRRRSLPNKQYDDSTSQLPQKDYHTINQSLEVPPASAAARRYQSIDLESRVDDGRSIKSDRRMKKEEAERDNILKKLSQKNQQLRRQLKKISDELTAQIKHKKFVPKKRVEEDDDNMEQKSQANAGIRRQLENGYRQIEMYKRTLQALKGKNEEHESDVKMKSLENAIASTDHEINVYAKRLEGVKNITKVQDKVIEKDINEDLKMGVVTLKKELDNIKKVLKEYAKRDRQRDVNYKKQQAYLFDVEKKYREVNGDYYPELKKKSPNAGPPIASRVTQAPKHEGHHNMTVDDYFELQAELNKLKALHEDYHRKIDAKVVQKNKRLDEQAILDENIQYNDKIIEALKIKLAELKKIFKPTKKSLFGYDNNYSGEQLQSEYNGGVDQIEKEIQEQVYQDQFDIKHLIANIPKPARQKIVIEFQDDGKKNQPRPIQRELSSDKGGMIISGQKSQPKKWGSSLTRSQEKGRSIKRQSPFDDSQVCPPESKPLIIGVNLWVNKNNGILGLQGIYLIGDQIRYGSKSSNSVDGFLQRYDLQSPDYLKNVTGAFSHDGYLQHLILYSKQGKIGTFGFKSEGQEQFNYGLSSSQRPFRFSGASFVFDSEPRINRLGLEITQQE